MTNNLLINKNFKFLGKTQQELYKEAMEKKSQPPSQKKPVSVPTPFGKIVPLIGKNGEKGFTAMEAVAEAIKQNKILAHLKDADAYVRKNRGEYWTGEFICYPALAKKFSTMLSYQDLNDVKYQVEIPPQFQKEEGTKALRLSFGYHSDGSPYFEFRRNPSTRIWTLHFNQPDALIQLNLLQLVTIHRKDGWYLTDATKFPNGKASDEENPDARYFYQVYYGPYLGLLTRYDALTGLYFGTYRYVDALMGPSFHYEVLVYE